MSTPGQRQQMSAQIVKFEARRDSQGRIKVYFPPGNDGGGKYEVAGINVRYHPDEALRLRRLIETGRQTEAETESAEYIASYTDTVQTWTTRAALEFYLRDSTFNRGRGGAAKILQLALGLEPDGGVGPITRAAAALQESDTGGLLNRLRSAREEYEVRFIGRRENFWEGLTNRWNDALDFARTFL